MLISFCHSIHLAVSPFLVDRFLSFDQYQRAGYKLLPVENGKIDTRLGLQAFIYAMLLLPVIFIGFSAGLVTSFGAIGIGLLSLYFMWRAWTFYRRFDKDSAKALMFSSFIYLPAALMILWWSM